MAPRPVQDRALAGRLARAGPSPSKAVDAPYGALRRVDAVQMALFSFTGVPIADQIVMFKGSKMDPNRLLSSYKLPLVGMASATCCACMEPCTHAHGPKPMWVEPSPAHMA